MTTIIEALHNPNIAVTTLPATAQPAPEGDFTLEFTFADADTP